MAYFASICDITTSNMDIKASNRDCCIFHVRDSFSTLLSWCKWVQPIIQILEQRVKPILNTFGPRLNAIS